MHSTKNWLGVPSGWDDVALRALKTAVVGFVALLLWDWLESNDLDPAGVATNAVAVAVGLFLLDAILMWTKR